MSMEGLEIGKRIRQLRMMKGLTLAEMASGAELTKGFLSQLERDQTSPSINTLRQILNALGTDLPTFFSPDNSPDRNFLKRRQITSEKIGRGIRKALLLPAPKFLEMEPYLLIVRRETSYSEEFKSRQAFAAIVSGEGKFIINGNEIRLKKGDYFFLFAGDILKIMNNTSRSLEVLFVVY